jgi:hypothetical protein
MALWLSKPVYELLPHFYALVGVLLAGGSRFLSGYQAVFCLILGLGLVVAGTLLWWRRRVYRRSK